MISGKALFLTPLPLNRGAAESLGIAESPKVPQKALGVHRIAELDCYYLVLVKSQLGVPPNCKQTNKGCREF